MYVIPLVQISANDKVAVGGKALSLAQLAQAKFAVPEGFTVTAKAFKDFLQAADMHISIKGELDKVSLDDLHSVDYASRIIIDLIKGTEIPHRVSKPILQQFTHINCEFAAIRSSSISKKTHFSSWSGELATFLHTDVTKLLENIKNCWASLYSIRSLYLKF